MQKIADHPEINLSMYDAVQAELFIKQFNLTTAPSMVIYLDGRAVGIISKGFTEKGIKRQLNEMTGIEFE